jgi:hypothetical protein
MSQHTYNFAAPIANAGGSFRSVKLVFPFKIERWSYEKIGQLVTDMEGPTDWSPDPRVDELHCIPEYGCTGHVVTGQLVLDHSVLSDGILKFHKKLEAMEGPLTQQIRLISLFLSAPILLAAQYWFEIDAGKRTMTSSSQSIVPYDSQPHAITYQEALELNAFLSIEASNTRPEFISIALDHWSHSFGSIPEHMQLLSLVTALEVLLNSANTELKHRVTRLAAVLLGDSKENSQEIYSGLGKIYDARSQVVHTGKLKASESVWYWQLRYWVSRAILTAMKLRLSKEELCRDLNQLGFGDGPSYVASVCAKNGR